MPPVNSGPGWRSYTVAAVLIIGIASAGVLLWSPKSNQPVERKITTASVPPPSEISGKPASAAVVPPGPPKASNPAVMHVDIEARQPSWVAITDGSGKRLMARIFEANETRSLELPEGATLRTGNAGGLIVRINGKEIGPLGPPCKVRDISFKDGNYKIHAPEASSAPAPLKT
jgi:hypothetical protein